MTLLSANVVIFIKVSIRHLKLSKLVGYTLKGLGNRICSVEA